MLTKHANRKSYVVFPYGIGKTMQTGYAIELKSYATLLVISEEALLQKCCKSQGILLFLHYSNAFYSRMKLTFPKEISLDGMIFFKT